MQTVDDLYASGTPDDGIRPYCESFDGFVIIACGHRREFGWCCGQLGWNWRYTRWLMYAVYRAVRR